ncbi:MAG: SH3 domain-containing protein [Saprospiraceae bacterium]|nr:SH3 domain-containing protein [Saprospiraceae bacterium]
MYNKKHSAITSIIMLFFVFSMMAARSREKDIYHNQGMIIMSESVQLKAGPDESSPVISDLAPGSKVYKNDFIGEWTQVRNEYGDLGWIRTTSAGKI